MRCNLAVLCLPGRLSAHAVNIRDNLYIAFELRFRIEANLAGEQPLAMFQMPGQFGGKLEVVERVEYDTIEYARAAGMNIGNAEAEYAAGANSFSSKQYGSAYRHFANAYKAIVNAN